ncbi:hypothetical protein Hanom_Chr15g01414251 [Helianthus anomalus]
MVGKVNYTKNKNKSLSETSRKVPTIFRQKLSFVGKLSVGTLSKTFGRNFVENFWSELCRK